MAEFIILAGYACAHIVYDTYHEIRSPRLVLRSAQTTPTTSPEASDDEAEPMAGDAALAVNTRGLLAARRLRMTEYKLRQLSKAWTKRERLMTLKLTALQRCIQTGRLSTLGGTDVSQIDNVQRARHEAIAVAACLSVAVDFYRQKRLKKGSFTSRPEVCIEVPPSLLELPFPPPAPPRLNDFSTILPESFTSTHMRHVSQTGGRDTYDELDEMLMLPPPDIWNDVSPPAYERPAGYDAPPSLDMLTEEERRFIEAERVAAAA